MSPLPSPPVRSLRKRKRIYVYVKQKKRRGKRKKKGKAEGKEDYVESRQCRGRVVLVLAMAPAGGRKKYRGGGGEKKLSFPEAAVSSQWRREAREKKEPRNACPKQGGGEGGNQAIPGRRLPMGTSFLKGLRTPGGRKKGDIQRGRRPPKKKGAEKASSQPKGGKKRGKKKKKKAKR